VDDVVILVTELKVKCSPPGTTRSVARAHVQHLIVSHTYNAQRRSRLRSSRGAEVDLLARLLYLLGPPACGAEATPIPATLKIIFVCAKTKPTMDVVTAMNVDQADQSSAPVVPVTPRAKPEPGLCRRPRGEGQGLEGADDRGEGDTYKRKCRDRRAVVRAKTALQAVDTAARVADTRGPGQDTSRKLAIDVMLFCGAPVLRAP
jgi:hypothetical protein